MGKVENPKLAKGLAKYGPGKMLHLSGKWRFVPKNNKNLQKKQEKTQEAAKVSKWYKAAGEDCARRRKKVPGKLPTLKKGLEPGRVCIILAGRFQGKRVVFLKQLEKSGLLLVTGPYEVNGVPLRRIPQSYVIVTSTKLDIGDVSIPDEVSDSYFSKNTTRQESEKKRKLRNRFAEEKFFKQGEKPELDTEALEERKAIQKKVDEQVVAAVKKVDFMREYLRDIFGLRNGDVPHRMVF